VERCDVLVVGGGPAGSSCAWGLRDSRLHVVVADRAAFPREKACAGWITPRAVAALGLDLELYREGRVLQPLRGFALAVQGGVATPVDCGEVVSWGVRRSELDGFLLERGPATLRLGEPLEDLRREGGRWVMNGALSARVVVGAGGHFCPVARRLGARPGGLEPATWLARAVEFEMTPEQRRGCAVRPDLPALYLSRDLRGCGWVVRKGDWLCVGLLRREALDLPARTDAFLSWLATTGRAPARMPKPGESHAYLPNAGSPRPLAAEGVLLAGDAAGVACARSGEGIGPAVESGLLAARAIAAGIRGSHTEMARAYARAVLARLGARRGRVRPGLVALLPEAGRSALARRALASPVFARRVVVERWLLRRGVAPLGAG
jgi:flavin-dependent dehydrogenase